MKTGKSRGESSRIPDNLVLESLQSFFYSSYIFEGRWSGIRNPDDATLAPLSILNNMQIKAAITEIPFFGHSSLHTWDKRMKMVSDLVYFGPQTKKVIAKIFTDPKCACSVSWRNFICHAVGTVFWVIRHVLLLREEFRIPTLTLHSDLQRRALGSAPYF